MKFNRWTIRSGWAAAVLGGAALLAAGAAQARGDVYWSVGVSSPGVAVGVANAPPVYVQPAPVYVQPAPVYVQPRPVYVQPAPVYVQPRPVYMQPRPVYMQPQPVYYGAPPRYVQPDPGYQSGWVPPGHRHWKHRDRHEHRGDWDDDRDGRWERRR